MRALFALLSQLGPAWLPGLLLHRPFGINHTKIHSMTIPTVVDDHVIAQSALFFGTDTKQCIS